MKNVICLVFLLSFTVKGQNTLSWKEIGSAPKATLADVAWIAGHWIGEAFGGTTEEIWSPPLGNSMMFMFRLITEGKVQFYEIGHIQQVDETLVLQLKHFHGNLEGWEEKDEAVGFKLVKLEGNRIYFDDFTFERISENEINIYIVIMDEGGKSEEVKFNYKKAD